MVAGFSDRGTPFTATLDRSMPGAGAGLDGLPEGGWGLALARATLDHLGYERAGDENRWRLVKRLPA